MNKKIIFVSGLLFIFSNSFLNAQAPLKPGFRTGGRPVARLGSNNVNDLVIYSHGLLAGTGEGLLLTVDRGASWVLFDKEHGLGKGGVSAVIVKNDTIWVATAFDTTTKLGKYEAGGGISWSPDNGETWNWCAQPVDAVGEKNYSPTTTSIQNITYDIAVAGSTVWITSFGGGLRKSLDLGQSWQVVTVDGTPFNALKNLTHRTFSVYFDGEALWVGSAGGIHKTLDQGKTWITYDQAAENGISGNFVVAIGHQELSFGKRIWASTIEAMGSREVRAFSYTDDGGLTWTQVLKGEFVHNFAFDPVTDAVYAATDNGMFKSFDAETWGVIPNIQDQKSGAKILTTKMASVAVEADQSLWVGSGDGLAFTADDGYTWIIFRAYQQAGVKGKVDTYAFPNPFSPNRHNQLGDDGFVRFHFLMEKAGDVTVKVYDFAMELVCTVNENFPLDTGDHDIAWNGRNDLGEMVANGCYFYRIERKKQADLWGKVLILN